MNRSNSELEKLSSCSTENLSPTFQGIHVTFTAGSTDSLNLDTAMFSNGGSQILCMGMWSQDSCKKQLILFSGDILAKFGSNAKLNHD